MYGYQGEDWRPNADEASARAYGRFLGERLGFHRNLMWLLGGDNDPVGDVWDLDPGHGPNSTVRPDATWRDGLDAPSARHVAVLGDVVRDLMPLRPFDELFVAGRGGSTGRASAARSADGRTALVYWPGRRRSSSR